MRFINEIFVSASLGRFIPELKARIPQLKMLATCPYPVKAIAGCNDAETATCSSLKHLFGVIGNVNDKALWTAMLLKDIAMPDCRVAIPNGYVFTGHAHKAAYESIALLKDLDFSYDETREIVSLIENHEIVTEIKRMSGTFYEKVEKLKEQYPELDKLMLMGLCDALARGCRGTVKMCLDIMRRINSRYYRDAAMYIEHITETVSWEDKDWYGVPISA